MGPLHRCRAMSAVLKVLQRRLDVDLDKIRCSIVGEDYKATLVLRNVRDDDAHIVVTADDTELVVAAVRHLAAEEAGREGPPNNPARLARLAAIDEAARVPREFYDDYENTSCEHGCEDNYLKIEVRIRELANREQLVLPGTEPPAS